MFDAMIETLKANPRKIVFTEGHDARILEATARLVEGGFLTPILIGNVDEVKANAAKEGVVTLPSGLQYQVLKEGNGRQPKATDQVRCHYEGMLIDGTMFDSSVQRGEPATFGLQQVIAGWTEGLQLMQEGAKYRFFIPYNLAYGEHGAGQSIPPYAALIFDVELIKVK